MQLLQVIGAEVNSLSASYASTASYYGGSILSASYAATASFAPNYVLNSATSSFATTGSNNFNGNQTITGSLSTSGSVTIIGNETITGSLNVSGSNTLIGTEIITGSVFISGSKTIIGNNIITGSLNVTGSTVLNGPLTVGISTITTATVTSTVGSNTIFTQATGSYTSAFYKYTFTSQSNARAGEVMAIWNGTSVQYTDNSTPDIGTTSTVSSSVLISGANVVLSTYTPTAGWTIKSQVTYL
jgi:hypothetical protein